MSDNSASLHARMQRIEQSQERTDANVSGVRERVAGHAVTLQSQAEDIKEIRTDVSWLRSKMVMLLTVYGVATGVASAVAQWLLSHAR